MSAAFAPLDWQALSLAAPDRVLIEASAGTGKTWTIAALYLRLLLEGEAPPTVGKILVATFSEAAARELRERLRARLADAEHELQRIDDGVAPAGGAHDDDAVLAWLAREFAQSGEAKQALHRIQLARMDFDRAPIGTIHALCQRFLRDLPLDSGMAATATERLDEDTLLRECVDDFWRRRYLGDDEVDAAEEILFEDGPEKLLRDVRDMLAHDARILAADGIDALEAAIEKLCAPGRLDELRGLCDVKLYKRSNSAARTRLTAIADAVAASAFIIETIDAKVDEKLAGDELDKQQPESAAVRLRDHSLIGELRAIKALASHQGTFIRGRVLVAACEFCRAEIPRRAEQRQAMTYALMIANVHERVRDESGDMAQALFKAYPFALVDEFQDTDARQFEIFDAIYRDRDGATRGWLAMIGDPKQAIYGFRGGDIAAYLKAREGAATCRAMDTNYRSTQALVDALNVLYASGDGGFGDAAIAYQPMRCAGKAEQSELRHKGRAAAPISIHRFRGNALDKNGQPLTVQTELVEIALDDCAQRIVELLNDAATTLGDKPVTPGDIAVLLPKNQHVGDLRKRLVDRGVPCVGSGRESVLEGATAEELELFLAAILHPDDDGAVRGALATTLLGFDLRDIAALQTDSAAFESELDRFAKWHDLALARGAFAAVASLVAQRASALLGGRNGERIIADLRHLGELLAARETEEPGLERAIAWFAQVRRDAKGDGERGRRVRLLADSGAVQLMTLHAAKGLEFPVVFLPLAWNTASRSGQHEPKVLHFHDDGENACIDAGSGKFADHLQTHFVEDLHERMRLLYVAVTRAKSALHVYWVDRGVSADDVAWEIPAIDILLRQAMQAHGLALSETALPDLADKIVGIAIADPAPRGGAGYSATQIPDSDRIPYLPLPALRRFEWLHSFSGILRSRVVEAADAAADDEVDSQVVDVDASTIEPGHPELLALRDLGGRAFGDAVHKALEAADMRSVDRALLRGKLAAQGIASLDEQSEAALLRMLERVRDSDLGDGLRLMDLAAHERIAEFEFQFPIGACLHELRAACVHHGFADVWPTQLRASELDGMLTGFADLIYFHGGRYHVLDYKTNRLGKRVSDFCGAALDEAMRHDFYPLQALLYTVALHRYLRQRLQDYLPERHLGDSVYLFLRGVGLAPGAGVWRRRWPAALIDDLDAVFAGAEVAA